MNMDLPFALPSMDPLFLFLIGSFGMNMIMFIFIVMMLALGGKPIFTFMKAKLTGKDVLAILKKDKKLVLRTAEEIAGIFKVDKFGSFIITPGSTFLWPNGCTGAVVYGDFGHTQKPRFVQACTAIKEQYPEVKDIHDLEEVTNNIYVKHVNPDGREILIPVKFKKKEGEGIAKRETVSEVEEYEEPKGNE